MPWALSVDTNSAAALEDEVPERESKIRFLAPLSTIHRTIDLPSPPNPPAIKYVAFWSIDQVE